MTPPDDKCPECRGTGREFAVQLGETDRNLWPCPTCNGTGKRRTETKYERLLRESVKEWT